MGGYCCKGSCILLEFKAEHIMTRVNRNAFKNGFKRCRLCEYYIKDINYCPCCGARLAIGPRNAKSKRILKAGVVRY